MDQDEQGNKQEVRVRFSTKLGSDYEVTSTPFSVPTRLSRYGLSEVINHLLSLSKPVPFDFLTPNGQFLRTSIVEYLVDSGISAEGVLELEYVLALAKPNRVRDFQQEDWVASVAGFGGQDDLVIGSGLYSGKVQFLDVNQKETEEGEKDTVVEFVAHEEALTSITSLPSSSSSSTTNILTASKDFSVKCWGINTTDIHNLLTSEPKKNQKKPKEIPYTPNHLFTLQGHTASVEEVTVNEQGKIACTASFDKTLKLWDLEDSLSSSSSKSTERKTKRRKGENGNETTPVGGANVVVPTGTLVGHTQAVSSAVWLNAGKVASGSWDYSVKIWDVESCACVQTFEGNKAVTSLTASHASGMLGGMFVSGHCDPLIRVWDYREGKMEGKKALKSHSAWVSSVEWHPTSDFLFVSGSYDGSVKVWDVRSMLPMHTVAKLHKDKVLCVKWCGDKTIISGGADRTVRVLSVDI